ncbi:4-hydroxythreonine-4-phosphate dehydrogenase PdxA [Paraprevotella clara]|jgi:4-hydroxythreonine-4-phosphate dehydrogenase|uniref:4-hydroxythreonine-4-phosphate dehydrogenase PdxA n=1 Tax=Paraprevotella clara TaxID=454154 RepID=UPI0026765E93|nr:4-hydroxythreonine-4-phosphate dehydrogenase PdxA [Paraprevotella clara]
MKNGKILVGITHGDINGVGYEIILKLFSEPMMLELCTPIIYGSPKVATYHRKAMELTTNFVTIQKADEAVEGRLNLVDCLTDEVKIDFGQPSAESGKAALAALERAMADYREGLFDVLVTAPINKATIQGDGFHFPGHTEYIQERAGEGREALMILMNDVLRVALVTTHLPIRDVAQAITKEAVMQKIRIFHEALRKDFNVSNPRIAVLALNPHAGDDGLLGTEEKDIIRPALQEMEKEGVFCFGPYAADGFFGNRTYEHFDGVLAMYHDQGLAPFKALSMTDGVNYTAGLPIVRTSPDHGTAYDIAGQGKADEASFRQAVYAALDVYRNRVRYEEAYAHPLRKQYHERRDDSDKLKLNAPEE